MKISCYCLLLLVTLVVYVQSFTSERLSTTTHSEETTTHSEETTTRRVYAIRGAKAMKDKVERRDQSDDIRLFVRYANETSRFDVTSVANEVIDEYPDEKLVVVKVSKEIHKDLEKNDQFIVEVDNPVKGFADVQRMNSPLSQQRRLEEEVPYGLKMIQADQLSVGSEITVCIVDTGYAYGHPDLPLDTTGDDSSVRGWKWDEDFNGHGSHVAGTLAAISGNNIGVSGAGQIKLHITRGLDENSSGYESDVRRAVEQCVEAGAKIITLSLGSTVISDTANALYTKTVEEDGLLMISAAGNQGSQMHAYPASHPSVISVSAVYEWEKIWEGSNYCDQVEFAGPGYQIRSTTVSTSAVQASGYSFPAFKVSGAPLTEVVGNLVYCGGGNSACVDAAGAICLMTQSQTDLSIMLENCESGGGIGAIVFDAADTLRAPEYGDVSSPIPAVGVRHMAGLDLLSAENTVVGLGYTADSDSLEYTYEYFTGTSMATPHVAAAAALVWSHFPECSNHQIQHALAVTAQDQGISGCDWDYGFGIVKAKDAYDWLSVRDCTQGDWWDPSGDAVDSPVCERSIPEVLQQSEYVFSYSVEDDERDASRSDSSNHTLTITVPAPSPGMSIAPIAPPTDDSAFYPKPAY